jgi:hypothetical protein
MRPQSIFIASACIAIWASVTSTAGAFDYNEHANISLHALDALERQGNAQLSEALATVIASDTTCATNELISYNHEAPEKCFVAADIPALAGDHAPSPVMTKWRWFDSEVEPIETSFVVAAFGLPFSVLSEDRPPEETTVGKPYVEGLLEYRSHFHSKKWGADFWRMSNIDLLKQDKSYVQLAARGHSHFRQRYSVATATRLSARRAYDYKGHRRNKPQQESYGWYADLHVGALWFAKLARDASATPDQARLFAGLAWFLELNAWHYIQDGVSAGHFLGDIDALEATTMHATHDLYGDGGVRAFTSPDLRSRASQHQDTFRSSVVKAGLGKIAKQTQVYVYGDGVPSTKKESIGDATVAWATLLSFTSGAEVASVLASATRDAELFSDDAQGRLDALRTCPTTTPQDELFNDLFPDAVVPTATKDNATRLAIYRCLHTWWETFEPGDESAQTKDVLLARRNDIQRAFYAGFFQSARLLPEPAQQSSSMPQHDFFSGGALGANIGLNHALDRDFVPTFTFHGITGAPRNVAFGLLQFAAYATFIPPEDDDTGGPMLESKALCLSFGGEWRPFWHRLPVASSVRFGALWAVENERVVPTLSVAPVYGLVEDGADITLGIGPVATFNSIHGAGMGVALDVGWWPNR